MNSFSEYKKMAEPTIKEKARNWSIAIGLQAVDGLTPSNYLVELARDNIEGKITKSALYKKLDSFYKTDKGKALGLGKKEADRVSAHIDDLLADSSFTFAPIMLFTIHDRLFYDVYPDIAGKIRKYNITKDEEVLNGDTVQYGAAVGIMDVLKHDFDNEKVFNYIGLSKQDKVQHIAKFISAIWQVHPFAEGNTRTIAVFAIKYLRTMGFDSVGNELFDKYSKYFRSALVRANYQNIANDIPYTMEYLYRFFRNLLLDENNVLKNSDMQIGAGEDKNKDEKARDKILALIAARPNISINEMAKSIGLSVAGTRWNIDKLKSEKIIRRIGARKLGKWEILK